MAKITVISGLKFEHAGGLDYHLVFEEETYRADNIEACDTGNWMCWDKDEVVYFPFWRVLKVQRSKK